MTTETYFSHSEANHFAQRNETELQQGAGVLDTLRRDPPGQSVGSHFQQSSKYRGAVYLAINTYMTAAGGATITCQRKRRSKGTTTFLPGGGGTIHKAASASPLGGDWEYVPAESDHPVQQLLDHPNERGDTFRDVYEYLMLQDGLTGVSPLWTVPNARHQPVELYALPTALTFPQFSRSEQYPNGSYRLTPYYASGTTGFLPNKYAGGGAVIPAEEIARRKRPHPYLMWDGYSTLSAGGVELDILEAIDQCWWGTMDHGTILDTMLMMPGADDSQVKRIEVATKARHGGARNMRRLFVMGGGDASAGAKYDVKLLSPNVRDMDFPEGRATILEFCLALFGVPSPVAGLVALTSYAQLYAALQQFQILKLKPDAQKWAAWFTRYLCDPWSRRPGEYIIQIELPTLTDPDMQQRRDEGNVNILSVNQRLASDNKPPVKYGEFPEPIYLALMQKEFLPQPVMMPGAPGSGGANGEPSGSAPRPKNKAGEGSRGPMFKSDGTRATRRVLRGPAARAKLGDMVKAIVEGK